MQSVVRPDDRALVSLRDTVMDVVRLWFEQHPDFKEQPPCIFQLNEGKSAQDLVDSFVVTRSGGRCKGTGNPIRPTQNYTQSFAPGERMFVQCGFAGFLVFESCMICIRLVSSEDRAH